MELLFLLAIVASSLSTVKGQALNCEETQSGNIVTINCNPDFTPTSTTCTFDGGAISCDFPLTIDASTLTPGTHVVLITATGNLNGDGGTFTLSSITNIQSVTAAQLLCAPRIVGTNLLITCTEDQNQSYTCSFDGMTAQPCSIPATFNLTSFSPGNHTLVVNAIVVGTGAVLMSGTIIFSTAESGGSCVDAGFTSCCEGGGDPPCSQDGCFCDQLCHSDGDCCSDILDINCFPEAGGSCVDAGFTSCCEGVGDPPCSQDGCFCDQPCYSSGDCCSDILDINCFPEATPTLSPSLTLAPSSAIISPSATPFITPGPTQAPQPIDIQCNVSPNSEMTVYSYSCVIIIGDSPQDTLVCTVDGAPRVPCQLVDSINVFDFAPGVHTATITVTDTLGSSASQSFDFTTPEALVLTCGAVGPPPVFNCSGNNPASSIRCRYDNSGPFFDCNFPLIVDSTLPPGPHNLNVVYTDIFGQAAEQTLPFNIAAPQAIDIQCNVSPNSEMTVYSYSCGIIIGDSPQDTLVCTVDGAPRVPCQLVDSIDVFDFEPGVHTATITVTDTLGSSDSESFDFITPGFCISETDGVTVRVECPNSGSIPGIDEFLCSLDGGIFFGCIPPISISALSEGSHTIAVVGRRTDGNGTVAVGQSQFVIDGLDLYFINDTPQVDGTGILHAQFRTNRPGSDVLLTCRLVGRNGRTADDIQFDSTQDCASGNVTYNGLPLGDYVFRVTANDITNGDVAKIRSGLWIVGNNDFCTITAINRRVTVFGNNATIEFGNNGWTPTGFLCSLDRQPYSPCSSPVTVTNVSPGGHRLRIRPAGCGRPGIGHRSISVNFEI